MTKEELALAYFISSVPGIGRRKIQRLEEQIGTLRQIFEAGEDEVCRVLSAKDSESFLEQRRNRNIFEEYTRLEQAGICFIPIGDERYPERLKVIPDSPYGLYIKGRMPAASEPVVAVIGARSCSAYGRCVAEQLGKALAEEGIGLISGMARGVDGIAQWAALQAGGPVYAVLGSGVDVCYPAESRKIYNELPQKGGVLSEYPPGTQPIAGNFPPRNRIISGLSDVVVVVEAREKSGTMITVDMALEQGREVYVVPGRLTDSLSRGCNQLIAQGAAILTDIEQIIESYKKANLNKFPNGWEEKATEENGLHNYETEKDEYIKKALLETLDFYPKGIQKIYDEISLRGNLKLTTNAMISALTELELENKIERKGGEYNLNKF